MVKVAIGQCENCGKRDVPIREIMIESGRKHQVCASCSRILKTKEVGKGQQTPKTKTRRKTSPVLDENIPTIESRSPPVFTNNTRSLRTTNSSPKPRRTTTISPKSTSPPSTSTILHSRTRRRISKGTDSLKHLVPGLDVSSMASFRILILIVGIALLLIGITLGDHFLVSEWAQYEWAKRLGY